MKDFIWIITMICLGWFVMRFVGTVEGILTNAEEMVEILRVVLPAKTGHLN